MKIKLILSGTLSQGTTNSTTETENRTSTAAVSPKTNTIPDQYLGPYAPDVISKHLNLTNPKRLKDTVLRPNATNVTQEVIKKKKTDREKDKDLRNTTDKKQTVLPLVNKGDIHDTNTAVVVSKDEMNKLIDLDQYIQYHKFMLDKPSPLYAQHNQILNVGNKIPMNPEQRPVSPNITYEIHEFPVSSYIPQPQPSPSLLPTNLPHPPYTTHHHPNFNPNQLIFQQSQHPQFPEELHIVRDNQHSPLGLEDIIEQIHRSQASGSPSTTDSRTQYTHVIHLQAHPGLPLQGLLEKKKKIIYVAVN